MVREAVGELDVEVSEENGLGEDSMMLFIREHLSSIFQPFALRVDGLRQHVDELHAALTETSSTATAKFADHSRLIREMRGELDNASQQVAEAQAGVAHVGELAEGLRRTQADVGSINDRQRTVQATTFELQHDAKANAQHLHRLSAELAQTELRWGKRLEDTAQKLTGELEALGTAQQSTARSLVATGGAMEKLRHELQEHSSSSERQLRKDETSNTQLRTSLSALETALKNTNHRVQEQAEQLKATKVGVVDLQRQAELLSRSQTVRESKQKDMAAAVAALQDRAASVEEDVSHLSELLGLGADPERLKDLFGVVEGLSEQMAQANASLDGLDQTAKLHHERILAGDARASKVESAQVKHSEALELFDKQMSKRISGLEVLHGHEELSRLQEKEHRAAETAALHKVFLEKAEAQDREVVKTQESLRSTVAGLELASERLGSLQKDLSLTNATVEKLRNTMDLTQEYWKGLTKGLRQTHRSIAVENEMFPAKEPQATTLPALAKTASVRPVSARLR